MSITDHISMPSTSHICPSTSTRHETNQERLERRLRQAGLDLRTCPLCDGLATQETVTVHRPGQVSVQRVLLRCLRRVTRMGMVSSRPRCPVQVLAEAPVGEPMPDDLLPAPLPDPCVQRIRSVMTCEDCGQETPHHHHNQRCCPECSRARELERRKRKNAARRKRCPDCGEPCYGERCHACISAHGTLPSCATPPLPDPDHVRTCADCGRSISDQPVIAVRCVECSGESNLRIRDGAQDGPEAAQAGPEDLPRAETTQEQPEAVLGDPEANHDNPPDQTQPREPEEETSMPKTHQTPTSTCPDCQAPIIRVGRRVRCPDCQTQFRLARNRERACLRHSAKQAEQEPLLQPGPAPAHAEQPEAMREPPRALRRSVLELAQHLVRLPADVLALLYDIASLSHERRALLWSVVLDAEEVA